MEFFPHRGRQLAYLRRGASAPIVFLHNGGTSHAIWQAQLTALAGDFEVWAPDLPGYGQSTAPASYALAAYRDTLAAFLQAKLGDTPVTLVGNCMGSALALSYALAHPARVQALVLINPLTPATFAAGGLGALQTLRQRQPRLTQLLAQGAPHLSVPAALAPLLLRQQLGSRGRALRLWRRSELRACYRAPHVMAALTGLFQALPQYAELETSAAATSLPPLYTLWGAQNRVLSATAGAALNRRLQPVQALTLADCGHLPMLERPEAVTALVRTAAQAGRQLTFLPPQPRP